MVPRRVRDDTARRSVVIQAHHRIGGAARLERADLLQVFALEERLDPEFLVEPGRGHDGRSMRMRFDPPSCGPNVVKGR